jgi:tyrosine-protein kinase Etk/Wzc
MDRDGRNLLDYLYVVVRWRRFIVVCVLAVSLATAAISMTLPLAWTASTTLLPPEEEQGTFGISALIGAAVPAGLGGLVGGKPPSENLVVLLESRRLLGAVVDHFDLVEEYGAPHRLNAIDMLYEQTEKEIGLNGAIKLRITAGDAQKAADMANYTAAQLDSLNRQIKREKASSDRYFLQERQVTVRLELEKSGQALRTFQKETGLVNLEVQTAAVIEIAQGLIQELAKAEVLLEVAQAQFDSSDTERWSLEQQVSGMRHRLDLILSRGSVGGGDIGPGLDQIPDLGLEYAGLVLEVKLREEVLAYLQTRLEEAKYREALDTPTIQVLDAAVAPQVRSAPRRTLMVLMAAALSFACSLVLAFVFEAGAEISRQNKDKIEALKRAWRRQD